MEYIPSSCEWPECDDEVSRHRSYCTTHHQRVYKVVDKATEAIEFKTLFKNSKNTNFSEDEINGIDN